MDIIWEEIKSNSNTSIYFSPSLIKLFKIKFKELSINCFYDLLLFNKQKTELVAYPAGKKENSYIIPDSVTSIGSYAFEYCTRLTSITIPSSVTILGDRAFSDCSSLTSVVIPDSVTTIGEKAFYNCTSLKNVNYKGTSSQWLQIKKGNLWDYYYIIGAYGWESRDVQLNYTLTYNY